MVNVTLTGTNDLNIIRLIVMVLLVSGVSGQSAGGAQGLNYAGTIILSNTRVFVTAESNSTSEVSFTSIVTNNDTLPVSSFQVRFDMRHLELTRVQVDGVAASTNMSQTETYVLVTIMPAQPILAMASVSLVMEFVTSDVQQSVGLSPDGMSSVYHLIYYLRTLNEITNLTMSIAMPPHSILEQDVAAPLFPDPTFNYTDGERLVFVWSASKLLPGQEIAYIVKYELPIQAAATASSLLPTAAIAIASALIGAAVVLSLDRVPTILKRRKRMEPPKLAGISDNEARVVEFIGQKGGSCTQREIYEELNLSQSMVSTILATLEQRGTIRRFKDGRENVVHLME
jgi:uncharacterized membrane protein